MKLNPTFRNHARFATQLKRISREMASGRHDEVNAYYVHMAGIHIAQLARLNAELERRLNAEQERCADIAREHSCQTWSECCDCGGMIAREIEAPRPQPAPYLRPAATVAALALGAASVAAILGNLP